MLCSSWSNVFGVLELVKPMCQFRECIKYSIRMIKYVSDHCCSLLIYDPFLSIAYTIVIIIIIHIPFYVIMSQSVTVILCTVPISATDWLTKNLCYVCNSYITSTRHLLLALMDGLVSNNDDTPCVITSYEDSVLRKIFNTHGDILLEPQCLCLLYIHNQMNSQSANTHFTRTQIFMFGVPYGGWNGKPNCLVNDVVETVLLYHTK